MNRGFGILEHRHDALDVVPVHVRHNQQLERALSLRRMREAILEGPVGGCPSAVYHDPPWIFGVSIGQNDTISLTGWEHFDPEDLGHSRGSRTMVKGSCKLVRQATRRTFSSISAASGPCGANRVRPSISHCKPTE